MKHYALKKELPMFPAGTEFRITKKGHLAAGDRAVYHKNDLKRHPELLEEWFDEIPEDASWEDNAIKSELAKVLIAPVDYAEGDKKHFSWEEACAIEKKLGNGWRLPTRSEWVLICEELGQKDGGLNMKTLMGNLKLGLNGADWRDGDGVCYAGGIGYYWSSTPVSDGTQAYSLVFSSTGSINPSNYYGRQSRRSVRLVMESKK